jgi:3'-5' exoribonuclease 1
VFPQVLARFEAWLDGHGLLDNERCALVTDGPWDFRDFFRRQCRFSGITPRRMYRRWVNLRKVGAPLRRVAQPHLMCVFVCVRARVWQAFQGHFRLERWLNLEGMLHHLDMVFEGSPHAGIDDTHNIARIARELHRSVRQGLKGGRVGRWG